MNRILMFQNTRRSLVLEHMADVRQGIHACFNANGFVVQQAISTVLASEHSQIRQQFSVLVAGALYCPKAPLQRLAGAVELIHAALDFHHQVDSEGEKRPHAVEILLGDLLFTGAFKLVVGLNSLPVMQVLSRASSAMAEAEVEQRELGSRVGFDFISPHYLGITRRRHAMLFEATVRCFALLTSAPIHEREALAAYGLRVGTAYQLWQDFLSHPPGEQAKLVVREEINQARAALVSVENTGFKSMLIDYAGSISEGLEKPALVEN